MNGKIIIGTELNTKQFDAQIEDLEERLKVIDAQLNAPKTFGLDKTDIQELEVEAEKLTNRLVQLKRQQAEIGTQGLQKISKSLTGIIKKVGKWALAIFGVRSAYMFVRQAMSTLSQYDKQLATDIQFIRYAVASTLEPVIKFIVQLAYKLLTILNTIWTKIFGVSLFSKNLAQNFKNAKNQASGLKKTLAGFDEMNVLGSGGGVDLSPSFDPSQADKGIDNWIDKAIAKIKSLAKNITGILNSIFPGLNLKLIGTTFVNDIKGAFDIVKGIITNNIPLLNKGIGEIATSFKDKIMMIPGFFQTGINLLTGSGGPFVKLGEYLGKTLAPKIGDIFKQMWAGIKQGGIDMWNGLKSAGKGFAKAIVDLINFLIDAVNGFLSPFRAIIVGIGSIINKKWTMKDVKIPHVKALAKGGIVNLPGKGVPVGGAIAGERSAEGVIPLTDSQQMALLGEAIGRYITINATVVNSMNGRVLSREIQKIQNQSDFAMNR